MTYTIGEIAELLNLPTSTLRYYDKQGLLPFVERSKNGIRIFKEKDYEWLKIIECLKKSGLKLSEIKEYIDMAMRGDETIDERLDIFLKQRENVIMKIKELENTLEFVEFKCWYYKTAKEYGTVSVPKNMDIEEIPCEYRHVWKDLIKSPESE